MRLFVRLVELKSFTAAARDLRIKQSTASKWLASLETSLDSTLVERTTRSLRVTDAGQLFYRRAQVLLADFEAATAELRDQSPEPQGRLRVSMPVVFGRLFIVPLAAEFLRQHARVELELLFNDRYVNLVEEGIDVAVRVGVPVDTSAKARKLADSKRYVVASPAYVTRRGAPTRPQDLKAHDCLVHGDTAIWSFRRAGAKEVPTRVHGRVKANNSEAVLQLARTGLGIALVADWLVEADLRAGNLIPLLAGYEAPPAPIFALTPPSGQMTTSTRAFVEHLAATLPLLVRQASRTASTTQLSPNK